MKGYSQDNLLKRKVKLDVVDQKPEELLLRISSEAEFTFSYDASIFSQEETVSLALEDAPVKTALDKILPKNVHYKISGNHLILLKHLSASTPDKKEKYLITGQVYNAENNVPLKNTVVYEISSLVSVITDHNGAFSMSVPTQFEQLGLSFSQKSVQDTVILLPAGDQEVVLSLNPAKNVIPAVSIKELPLGTLPPVETLSFVQQVVSRQSLLRTKNTDLALQTTAQVSFVPVIGTNLKMGGLIENKYSLNILVGYARGVGVFELGGLFNIIREDVKGAQISGLGNFVGGDTHGLQLGGLFNHNRGALRGLQIGGINNMLIDSLKGVQFAGINNILKGGMKGWQITGINNLTTGNVDGVQFAGLTNVALEDVRKIQVAGLVNKGRNVEGLQFAGLVNLAKEDIKGVQLAGLINKARNVKAVQFAGLGNAADTVFGAQLAGLLNHSRYSEGAQLALINIADSVSGIPIGLFSYVKKGLQVLEFSSNEITPVNMAFKTGVRRFYNIFSGGYGDWGGSSRWSFGYGFGTERYLTDKLLLNLEYNAYWVNEKEAFQTDLSLLNRLGVFFGQRKQKGISMSGGPAVNIWLSEWRDPDSGAYLTQLAPYKIAEENLGTTLLQMWIGGKLAVRLN
ncbi:STN domain-containing protein [Fulvivirga imtechensis]|uniref:STN domain-containing protein n=1 Tax=Fulvivirga imtechensis TaxID=881893 RepID=UPI0012F868D6|nr:STN domain-containing protein [Fulvivirga imtechensis]